MGLFFRLKNSSDIMNSYSLILWEPRQLETVSKEVNNL